MSFALVLDEVKKNPELLGKSAEELKDFFVSLGEKSFRATQVLKWVHQLGVTDFAKMSNLSQALRAKLDDIAKLEVPKIVLDKKAQDGTRKFLIELSDGNKVETVYIPTAGRGTLCISSQVGCSLNCEFCYTAQQGYSRNLSSSEIISQLWLAQHVLLKDDAENKVTNVVIMGMGEPLLNFDATLSAIKIMLDDNAYGLSRWKITVSTSGVVPKINELGEKTDVALAVSLHAPNDKLRDKLVPINNKYPLQELLKACKDYVKDKHKMKVTFEYVMLDGINDTVKHAKELIRLLQGVPAKVNLIPHNPFPGSKYKCSKQSTIADFQQKLMRSGINTIVRRTRGQDIEAACGQLAGKVQDKTRRSKKAVK